MRSTVLACGLMLWAQAVPSGAALAQTTGPAPAPAAKPAKAAKGAPKAAAEPAKPDPAAAERAMESGIKSYEAGKNEPAAQALTVAMQGGALAGPKMARALYYRGLAYKKLGKPAQSISDLTSALWLKGGLSEAERADALAQRESAYKEAGIGQAPAVTTAVAKSTPAAPASASVAATPAASGPAASAAAKPDETASAQSGAGSGGVGSFFSNLFSSGSTSTPAPAAAGAASATATGSVAAAPETSASSWSSATKSTSGAKPITGGTVAAAAAAPVTKVAAATPAPAVSTPAAAAPVADGKFRLQVAAVRSRAEADAVVVRLKKEFAKKLASREPSIDEAVIGNMGTFYRVRVGPYASANEPRQLCITLRASGGYDCLVVTQ